MQVRYTRHGEQKFAMLKKHGFDVSREQVDMTVRMPDSVMTMPGERFVAQRAMTNTHLLRVVYRLEEEAAVVITFYPGRRNRYEDHL